MKKKEKLGRKLLSFLLALAMVVGLMPGMSVTTLAQVGRIGNVGELYEGYILGHFVDGYNAAFQGYITLQAGGYIDENGNVGQSDLLMPDGEYRYNCDDNDDHNTFYDYTTDHTYRPYANGKVARYWIVVSAEGSYYDGKATLTGYDPGQSNNPFTEDVIYRRYSADGKPLTDGTLSANAGIKVESDTLTWYGGNTYVVSDDVTITDRIKVKGKVNLILLDGAKLTANEGISVNGSENDPREAKTLNIYAGSMSDTISGTGQLIADARNCDNGYWYCAGLGGDKDKAGGILNIYGGVITAYGCGNGAGIGGGEGQYHNDITIYGGTISAYGGEEEYGQGGAGIGSGWYATKMFSGANVKIYGGNVTAVGGNNSAGIGGGAEAWNGGDNVYVYGGTVVATGAAGKEGIGKGSGEGDSGNLTLGCVKLETSTDNVNWTEATNTSSRTQYMRITPVPHDLTEHPAVAATCTTSGNSAYWKCNRCGKYFSDAEGLNEIAVNSWGIPATGHNISYSADDDTITATCSNSGCELAEGISLSVIAPEETIFDGSGKEAHISTGYDTTVFSYVSDITYTKDNIALTGAPVDVGTYVASVSAGASESNCVTASITYTIEPASMTVDASDVNVEYDGNPHGISVNVSKPENGSTVIFGREQGTYDQSESPTITDVLDSPFTVYYKVTADNYEDYTGSAKVTITNASQTTPDAPTMDSATATSITLTNVTGCEYSKDGSSWQTSNIFTGLTPDTTYTFYQRKAAATNYNASLASSGAEFRTNAHVHDFSYTVDGDTITATCADSDGGHGTTKTVTLTLNSPTLSIYNGSGNASAILAQTELNAFNSATGKSVSESDIKYVGRDGTSYNESTTAPTDAGKYRASITVENVTAYVDYEISKAAGSISYGSGSVNKTYGDAAFTNELTHTGDGTVTYSSSNPAVATVDENSGEVTVAGVGNTTIKATVADSNNYSYDSKEASYTLTVNKGSGSISYEDASVAKTYGDETFTQPLAKTGDGNVTYESSNTIVATVDSNGEVSITGVGSTTITATVSDTDNFEYAIKTATYTLNVSKGDQTITAADMSLTNGVSGNVSATTSGDGAINYAVKSGSEDYIDVASNGAVTVKEVPTGGVAYITVTASSTDHYNEATKEVAVTISKATVTVTANSYNILIGDAIPDLTSAYEVIGFVGSDTFATSPTLKYQQNSTDVTLPSTATSAELGTYDIVPSGADAGSNYDIAYTNGTLTVGKLTPAVTNPAAQELTYNGSAQNLVSQGSTSEGLTMQYALGDATTVTGTWGADIPTQTDAGTYYVWYKVDGNDTYESVAATPISVTINPKSIAGATVTLSATEFIYDEQEHSVTVDNVAIDGITLTEGTDYSVSGDLSGTDKKTYTVTVTVNNPNYTGSATATWSIGLATPVINTIPTTVPVTYGQPLGNISLEGGTAEVNDGTGQNIPVAGTFSWKSPETVPGVTDSDTTEYEVIFTPDETDSFAPVTIKVKVTVNKAETPSDNPAPTPKTELTDNGQPQELINPVTVTGGTIQYVIGTDSNTPPTGGWGTGIPTGVNPGTYYVWYKIVGDANHLDSNPKCIVVTIADAPAPAPSGDVTGYVKDVTGTSEATGTFTFGQRIVNNENLKALLSLSDDDVNQGTKVWLDVTDIGANVSSEDKTLIDGAKGDYVVGLYLDINLYKKIGSNDAVKVTETNGKVKISILIPENLRKSGRTFEIIRIHEGQTTVIPGTYDENTHIFTFETDRFSTYAIAYKDGASNGNTAINTNTSTGNNMTGNATVDVSIPKTDGTTGLGIWYILLFDSLGVLVLLAFARIKKEE